MKKGLTLVEVMMALVLSGILAMVGSKILQQPAVLVTRTVQRLDEDQIANLALRELANNLSKTHPHATGLVACEGQTLPYPIKLFSGNSFLLEKPGDRFSFAYALSSSLVGIDKTSRNRLYLTDPRAISPGELIMLTHLNNSKLGGLFIVESVDRETRMATLREGGFDVPSEVPCNKSAASTSVDALFGDASPSIFNEKATTYRVDVIRFATYEMKKEAADLHPKIYKYEWPVSAGTGAEDDGTDQPKAISSLRSGLDMVSVEKLVVRPASDDELGLTEEANSGRTASNFAIEVVRFEKTSGGVDRKRNYKAYARFLLDSSERFNFAAPTLPPTAELKYPTCAVSAAPVNGIFSIPDAGAFPNLFMVSAMVSSTGGVPPLLMVETTAGSSGRPKCWKMQTAGSINSDAANNSYSDSSIKGPFSLNGAGATNVALGKTTTALSTAYDSAVCDLSEGGSLQVSMLYWDQGAGRNLRKICTGLDELSPFINQPYSFKGSQKNECSNITLGDVKIPKIEFGQLIKKDDGSIGPAFFITSKSCCWQNTLAGLSTSAKCVDGGYLGSCEFNPEKGELQGVLFYPTPPTQIKIDDPAYAAGYVKCGA